MMNRIYKLILIILFTISLNEQSSDILLLFGGDGLTIPSFASSSGAIQQDGATVNVNLPAVVDENDILIVQVNLTNFDVVVAPTFTLPSGWTMGDSISTVTGGDGVYTNWIWKRAVGDEDGSTVTITGSDLTDCKGTSLRFAGCKLTGTPYEANTDRGTLGPQSVITSQEITTLGDSRLVICLVNVFDDNTLSVEFSDYTKQQELTQIDGIFDAQLILETQEVSRAGTVTADSATNSGTDPYCSFTFALIPIGG